MVGVMGIAGGNVLRSMVVLRVRVGLLGFSFVAIVSYGKSETVR